MHRVSTHEVSTYEVSTYTAQHIFVALIVLLIVPSAFAQGPTAKQLERAKEDRQRMSTHLMMQQLMQLQHNRDMHVEIDLVEDQLHSLKEVFKKHQRDMMEFQRENHETHEETQRLMASGEHEAARELSLRVQRVQLKFFEESIAEAKSILLPHQFKRLQEISKQQLAKRANPFQDEFGAAIGMADELGLTEEEKQRLFEAVQRIRKEYYSEIAKLKEKANGEILENIPASKREKLKEIFGDPFDPDVSKRRNVEEHRRRMEERRKQMRRDMERKRRND